MTEIRNERILVTGAAGQIGFPLAVELAQSNEVWGVSRLEDPAARERLESSGVTTCSVDLADPDFSRLPKNFTYVIHFAVFQQPGADFDQALRVNAEGTGLLMSHYRNARAFLVMSSCSVYAPTPDPSQEVKETDPLDNSVQPYSQTYAISKIAQEGVARFAARQWNIPTTIARMGVSYGPNGGLPAYQFDMMCGGQDVTVEASRPSFCNPIHQDDINRQALLLLGVASVPATIVNWAGDEGVEVETYCRYMAEIANLKPRFQKIKGDIQHTRTDNTRRRQLIGDCTIDWQEGMRRMIAARHPELKLKA
ncbi:MAG: NAD(P)-dependent oxidoreductase [Deltaproteobacteria bacterium]|nr:NAD(P)-dependent oxidoreductase [Deltaproteobacteria bacterium]